MAIEKHTVSPHGLDAPSAYHRVESVTFTNKTDVSVQLRSYASRDAAEVGLPPFDIKTFSCPYDPAGGDVFAQVYEWIKNTPDYRDGINC